MVGYSAYKTLDDLPRRQRNAVQSMLLTDEKFQSGIDCAEGRAVTKWNTKLILTNQRILAVKKGIIGRETEDYSLQDITSIKLDTGLISGELTLQGSGIMDEYEVPKGAGKRFVQAVRETKSGT